MCRALGFVARVLHGTCMRKKLVVSALILTSVGFLVQQIVSIPTSVARGITKGMRQEQKSLIFKNRFLRKDSNQQEVAQTIKKLNALEGV